MRPAQGCGTEIGWGRDGSRPDIRKIERDRTRSSTARAGRYSPVEEAAVGTFSFDPPAAEPFEPFPLGFFSLGFFSLGVFSPSDPSAFAVGPFAPTFSPLSRLSVR